MVIKAKRKLSLEEAPQGLLFLTAEKEVQSVSCGYVLTRWGRGSGSNAPDLSHASSPGGCVVIAGGKPGRSTCFKSIATCLNISKVANGS